MMFAYIFRGRDGSIGRYDFDGRCDTDLDYRQVQCQPETVQFLEPALEVLIAARICTIGSAEAVSSISC